MLTAAPLPSTPPKSHRTHLKIVMRAGLVSPLSQLVTPPRGMQWVNQVSTYFGQSWSETKERVKPVARFKLISSPLSSCHIIVPIRCDFVQRTSLSLPPRSHSLSLPFSISTVWFLNTHELPLCGNQGTEDLAALELMQWEKPRYNSSICPLSIRSDISCSFTFTTLKRKWSPTVCIKWHHRMPTSLHMRQGGKNREKEAQRTETITLA